MILILAHLFENKRAKRFFCSQTEREQWLYFRIIKTCKFLIKLKSSRWQHQNSVDRRFINGNKMIVIFLWSFSFSLLSLYLSLSLALALTFPLYIYFVLISFSVCRKNSSEVHLNWMCRANEVRWAHWKRKSTWNSHSKYICKRAIETSCKFNFGCTWWNDNRMLNMDTCNAIYLLFANSAVSYHRIR